MKLDEEVLDLRPDSGEMQKKIDSIIDSENSHLSYEERIKEANKKKEEFSMEYNISPETVNELVNARDWFLRAEKTRENVNKIAWKDSVGLDWTNDINKAEINYDNTYKTYKYTQEKAQLESMVTSIKPEQVTPDFLYYLKGHGCNNDIYKVALDKFATSINPEQINKDVLEFLYENKYTPKEQGSILDFSYKMYCDGKDKDEEIKRLEESNRQKDEVIESKNDMIQILDERADSLENTLNSLKNKAKGFANRISENISKIGALQKETAEREQKGLFATIRDKIKSRFKKEKPLLLSESFADVQTDMNKIYGDINQEISKPSTVKSKEEAYIDFRVKKRREDFERKNNKDIENVK